MNSCAPQRLVGCQSLTGASGKAHRPLASAFFPTETGILRHGIRRGSVMRRSNGGDVWSISTLRWQGLNSWRLRTRRRHGSRVDMRWRHRCRRRYPWLLLRQMPWWLPLMARKSRMNGGSIGHALRWRSWLRLAALGALRKDGSAPLRDNISTGPHAWLLALATMFSMRQARLWDSATVDRFFGLSSRYARRCVGRQG